MAPACSSRRGCRVHPLPRYCRRKRGAVILLAKLTHVCVAIKLEHDWLLLSNGHYSNFPRSQTTCQYLLTKASQSNSSMTWLQEKSKIKSICSVRQFCGHFSSAYKGCMHLLYSTNFNTMWDNLVFYQPISADSWTSKNIFFGCSTTSDSPTSFWALMPDFQNLAVFWHNLLM